MRNYCNNIINIISCPGPSYYVINNIITLTYLPSPLRDIINNILIIYQKKNIYYIMLLCYYVSINIITSMESKNIMLLIVGGV